MYTIAIATAGSRTSSKWENGNESWDNFCKRISRPVITKETAKEYHASDKKTQTQIKDVGGFVGGYCINGERRSNTVERSILTLDIDNADYTEWDMITQALPDVAMLMHSTHSHVVDAPRLRIIVLLDKLVTPVDYAILINSLAHIIGDPMMQRIDKASVSASQMMYWPSTPCDEPYIYKEQVGVPLKAEEHIAAFSDKQDAKMSFSRSGSMPQDPTTKGGIVGVFCRTYTISEAISRFIAGVYIPKTRGRYTFAGGSTEGGLVVYDNMFAYSHHGTDDINNGHCHNAFDLVRVHLFNQMDANCHGNVRIENRPSYQAMADLVANDDLCLKRMAAEDVKQANEQLKDLNEASVCNKEDEQLIESLERTEKGHIKQSVKNIVLLISGLKDLKDTIYYDEFSRQRCTTNKVPWRIGRPDGWWTDGDTQQLRIYLSYIMGSEPDVNKTDQALAICDQVMVRNSLKDMIDNLPAWDMEHRVHNVLSQYLGTEYDQIDNEVFSKHLFAAICRVFFAGMKYDNAIVLVGRQGSGKSSLIRHLSMGLFSDGLSEHMRDAKMMEEIFGTWHVEIQEIDRVLKSKSSGEMKAFLSKTFDKYRKPYDRNSETVERQCVFWGTTNKKILFKDQTGNRRYILINDCNGGEKNASSIDPDTIKQIWAEVKYTYNIVVEKIESSMTKEMLRDKTSPIYIDEMKRKLSEVASAGGASIREALAGRIDSASAPNTIMDMVAEYLDRPLPSNWEDLTKNQMIDYMTNHNSVVASYGYATTYKRTYVCINQIMEELGFRKEVSSSDLPGIIAQALNDLGCQFVGRRRIPGWGQPRSVWRIRSESLKKHIVSDEIRHCAALEQNLDDPLL